MTDKHNESKGTGTVRQRMMELLKVQAWDSDGLSRALGVSQRQVEAHLNHVAKSVEGQGLRMIIEPSKCHDCGFIFTERTRTRKPGRCPRCRGEHMTPPLFSIASEK